MTEHRVCNPPRPCVSRITVTLTICSHGYLAHEEQATCGVLSETWDMEAVLFGPLARWQHSAAGAVCVTAVRPKRCWHDIWVSMVTATDQVFLEPGFLTFTKSHKLYDPYKKRVILQTQYSSKTYASRTGNQNWWYLTMKSQAYTYTCFILLSWTLLWTFQIATTFILIFSFSFWKVTYKKMHYLKARHASSALTTGK